MAGNKIDTSAWGEPEAEVKVDTSGWGEPEPEVSAAAGEREPTWVESYVEPVVGAGVSMLDGQSLGLADNVAAKIDSAITGKDSDIAEKEWREMFDTARHEHPVMNFAGAAALPVPAAKFGGGALKAAATIGKNALYGGARAATESLARGGDGDQATDAAEWGTAVGAVSPLAGALLGKAFDRAGAVRKWVADKFGAKAAEKTGQVMEMARDAERSRYAKEAGAMGPDAAQLYKGARDFQREGALREMIRPDQQAAFDALEGKVKDEVQHLADNQVRHAQEYVRRTVAPITDDSVNAAADRIRNEAKVGVWNQTKKLAKDVAASQGLIGAGVRSGLRYGKKIVDVGKSPATHERLYKAIERMARVNPAALGKYSDIGQKLMNEGFQAFAIHDYALSQRDPEWREFKQRLVDDDNNSDVVDSE